MRIDIRSESATSIPLTNSHSESQFAELLERGIAAAKAGDRASAREQLFQALAINSRCEDAWMWLASLSEYPEELLAFLNNALEANPDNQKAREWRSSTRSLLANTFVQRAASAHEDGQTATAHQCLDQAIAHDPACEMAWFWKASLADDPERRAEYLHHVLRLNPDNAQAENALKQIELDASKGKLDEAKSAAMAGKRKKAVELLNEFLKAVPESAEAWILKSHLSLTVDEKLEALKEALVLEPGNSAAKAGYEFLMSSFNHAPADEPEQDAEMQEQADEMPTAEFDGVADLPADEQAEEQVTAPAEPAKEDDEFLSRATPHFADYSDEDHTPVHEMVTEESLRDDISSYRPLFDDTAHLEETAVPNAELPAISFDEIGLDDTEEPILTLHDEREAASAPVLEEEDGDEVRAECAFCSTHNDLQAFECRSCRAALDLSDIDKLIGNDRLDRQAVLHAVTEMEAEWNVRELDEDELVVLGLGHLNLQNYDAGLRYLQEAVRRDADNLILSSQTNAIAIRLEEMRYQLEARGSAPAGRTILVVDDSATVRKLISGKLEKSGHTVVCANDGVEALQKLAECRPDLVLLDIAMPQMDGYEVCRQIRANPDAKDLPVVMISGKDGFFDKVRGRMAGTTGYVTKPFGPETLMKAIETYLVPVEEEVLA